MSEKKMQDFLISRTVNPVANAYKNQTFTEKSSQIKLETKNCYTRKTESPRNSVIL